MSTKAKSPTKGGCCSKGANSDDRLKNKARAPKPPPPPTCPCPEPQSTNRANPDDEVSHVVNISMDEGRQYDNANEDTDEETRPLVPNTQNMNNNRGDEDIPKETTWSNIGVYATIVLILVTLIVTPILIVVLSDFGEVTKMKDNFENSDSGEPPIPDDDKDSSDEKFQKKEEQQQQQHHHVVKQAETSDVAESPSKESGKEQETLKESGVLEKVKAEGKEKENGGKETAVVKNAKAADAAAAVPKKAAAAASTGAAAVTAGVNKESKKKKEKGEKKGGKKKKIVGENEVKTQEKHEAIQSHGKKLEAKENANIRGGGGGAEKTKKKTTATTKKKKKVGKEADESNAAKLPQQQQRQLLGQHLHHHHERDDEQYRNLAPLLSTDEWKRLQLRLLQERRAKKRKEASSKNHRAALEMKLKHEKLR